MIQKDSWINFHEWFGCNFSTWNIRNVWRARDDRHHYDVTGKCCGVTIITTRLVEWTLSIAEINVFFCCFQELSGFKRNTNGYPNKVRDKSKTTWAVGIAQLTHHSVRGPPFLGFLPPPWTLWWVNCAIPTAHVVLLYRTMPVIYHIWLDDGFHCWWIFGSVILRTMKSFFCMYCYDHEQMEKLVIVYRDRTSPWF